MILLSSSSALRVTPGLSVYAATKAAIRSLARTWAAELADRGIRVNRAGHMHLYEDTPTVTRAFSTG